MSGRNTKEEDEIEELLRAAEDSMRLDLALNSHIARTSSSSAPIHPDLDRRFQALRSTPRPSNSKSNPAAVRLPNPPPSQPTDLDHVEKPPEEDDLFARFAALKTSIPAYSSSPSSLGQHHQFGNANEEEDDEVEKLISWAIDAARLDPSPPSDIDDDDDDRCNSDDTDSDYSVDDDDDRVIDKKKGEKKGKTK